MTSRARTFVGIVGGFWELKSDPAAFDEAQKTARDIGAALAAARMGLVVYFSNDESLEPHVVAGYVKALPAGAGAASIRVRYAQSQRNAVKFAEQTHGYRWRFPAFSPATDAGDGGQETGCPTLQRTATGHSRHWPDS